MSIDTLKIAKRLQAQGLSREAAEELSEILSEFSASELASKSDLKELEFALKKDLEKTRAELQKEISETKAELQKEISETKAELQKEIRQLDIKIAQSQTNIIKWVAGFLVGQTALLFTLIKVFGN